MAWAASTTLSAVDSLALARDRFYASGRFADVFASVKRAPNALVEILLTTPGVADVQTSIERLVRIELPGSTDPVIGQLIGVDPKLPSRMNRVTLRNGRALDAGIEGVRLSDQVIPRAGVGGRCRRAWLAAGRAHFGAHQRQAPHAADHRHCTVARVHLCRSAGCVRPARLRRLLGAARHAGCGL